MNIFVSDQCPIKSAQDHCDVHNRKMIIEASQLLYAHFKALCNEYTFRTGKIHKTSELLSVLDKLPCNIKKAELEPFAMCIDDEYKRLGIFDQTVAYKAYLRAKFTSWACREKPISVSWGLRNKPEWI